MNEEDMGSYRISEWEDDSSGYNPEVKRLKLQVDMTIKKEERFWDYLGLKDGSTILEAGSGPGWVTKELIKKYPHSKIIGVELDPKMIEYFNKIMDENEKSHVEIINKSITETELPSNLVDFVLLRAILQHVPNTDKVITEMHRILKPGGVIYILDKDSGIKEIVEPEMRKSLELAKRIDDKFQSDRGGHPHISRYLVRKLRAANFIDVDFDALALHSDIIGFEMMKDQSNIASFKPFLDMGLITEEEATELIKEGNEFIENPDSLFLGFGFIATGRKG